MATRSSMLNRGALAGFSSTATTTPSKQRVALWMMSIWPLVTGSNVPGHRAMGPIVSALPDCSRGLEEEHGRVPVEGPPRALPVYRNNRRVPPTRAGQDDRGPRRCSALTCDFGQDLV